MAHNKGGGCDCRSWVVATIVYYGFFDMFLTALPWLNSISYGDDKPTSCAVELAGFKGLHPPTAAPSSSSSAGETATSPAFDLIVHVSNGHSSCSLSHGGGDVVISYAGVPLAHGRTPAMELIGSKAAASMSVKATASAGVVGVPGDLSRLMADERRWGVAQLQVEFDFASESFVCYVRLDAQPPRVFDCYRPITSPLGSSVVP